VISTVIGFAFPQTAEKNSKRELTQLRKPIASFRGSIDHVSEETQSLPKIPTFGSARRLLPQKGMPNPEKKTPSQLRTHPRDHQ
jgi:hypothetical protein